MAEPSQKSIEPTYIRRYYHTLYGPDWTDAANWRRVVKNQPVAGLCEQALLMDLQATDWEIRAKDPKEEDNLAEDIEYYRDNVLNPILYGGIEGFDSLLSQPVQDMLTIPFGGTLEAVRWPVNTFSLSQPYDDKRLDLGHVHSLIYIDGAGLSPTFDKQFPVKQKIPDSANWIFFTNDELARFVMFPRVDMQRWGYGLAPPERVYLAVEMLYRSDTYYVNLLLDTPEAGLLDLMDMSKDSAQQWIRGFRELFSGVDPFKIPVLYEHSTAAKYIPFGRPPTELMLDTQTLKYSQMTAAAYGLTLSDIGLGNPEKTMAGKIRDEQKSRRSGFGSLKEVTKNTLNRVLPSYLEFVWIDNNEETRIQASRSFLLQAQALEKAKALGAMTSQEAQAQLLKDGHITVEVEEPEEQPIPAQLPQPGQIDNELQKVPPGEGGRGDVTKGSGSLGDTVRASGKLGDPIPDINLGPSLGDPAISATPTEADSFAELGQIFMMQFEDMSNRASKPRLMRLIKAATRLMFEDVSKSFGALENDIDTQLWADERLKLWFGEPSEFDDYPDVTQASLGILKKIEALIENDTWWQISPNLESIVNIIKAAFSEGATIAAEMVQEFLYTEGLRDSPSIIGLSFNLKNPKTLGLLNTKSANLVTKVNDGTKFFLKRIITAGVDEGLSSPNIAKMIREGASAADVLGEGNFSNLVIDRSQAEIAKMSQARVNSIVNTEIAKAETEGRVSQWQEQGLTQKRWRHSGTDTPCPFCQANIDLDFVPIDHMYTTVFGEGDATGPPAHPQVDHCHIEFDEKELIDKADTLTVWTGD